MADSGPFKIVGWMSDNFSSWLSPDLGEAEPRRPLSARNQTWVTRVSDFQRPMSA